MSARRSRSHLSRALGLVVASSAIIGCAAPAAMSPSASIQADASRLVGRWVETPGQELGAPSGHFRIEAGRLQFETAAATGTLTLFEDGTRLVLRGEGSRKDGRGTFPVELTQRK